MDITGQVGETAGKIWHALSDDGPKSLAQLKKKVGGSNEVVQFAVGWLAREDKVEILSDKKGFRVQLK